jgi:hypothetical protein
MRLLRILAVVIVALLAVVAVLFALGARVVLDGGGGIHVAFVESAAKRERTIEAHRDAQRAAAADAATTGRGRGGCGNRRARRWAAGSRSARRGDGNVVGRHG